MADRSLPTPAYVIDEAALVRNLEILAALERQTGCKVLLAQKAFSAYRLYPLIGRYLSGTTASGLFEARLGREEMNKENHVYCPAYLDGEFDEIAELCDHIVFNSFAQKEKFFARRKQASVGLRVNPECSTQEHAIYDPCAPGSRLGVTRANFREDCLEGVEGLHFHTLCEQNADALEVTVAAFERNFGPFLKGMRWLNLGGGHHITRADYDRERLARIVCRLADTYGVQIYLEPGEAVALHAGTLLTTVLELVDNGVQTAILDASAACHMPDVLEMPYRPPLQGAGKPGEKPYCYRLASRTCLAGDVIGDYSFDAPLAEGDLLTFEDMAIYTMVKNNTFNGMNLPAIFLRRTDGRCEFVKSFGYRDFKERLS